MVIDFEGFDWDEGNWPKCGMHGMSRAQIEDVFYNTPAIAADPNPTEHRLRAIGMTSSNRYAFIVFTMRDIEGSSFIRPISARFMHKREVKKYE